MRLFLGMESGGDVKFYSPIPEYFQTRRTILCSDSMTKNANNALRML